MNEIWQRFAEDFVHRLDGPLHFRFIVQPLMAILFATRDGLQDARQRKPAYLWTVISSPAHRRELLHDGWKHFGKIFILGLVLDLVYQLKVHDTVYPGELLLTALVLAVLPYLLLRGPANRIARLFKRNA